LGYNDTENHTAGLSGFYDGTGLALGFYTNPVAASGSLVERMRISGGGNVGIGATSPSAPLDIISPVSGATIRATVSGSSNDPDILLARGSGASDRFEFRVRGGGGGAYMSLWDDSNGTVDHGLIVKGNAIGIGVVAPASPLDVAGDIGFTGCLFDRTNSTDYGGTCLSDARLKKNISPLTGALDRITRLKPVSYEFIDPKNGAGRKEGLLAQEVEKVYPGWVSTGADGHKRVTYGTVDFQMQMLEALRELKAENEALKAKVENLENRIVDAKKPL